MAFSFKNLVADMVKPAPLPDPTVFNDPLALKVSWRPLQGGGASFTTHKAVQVGTNRIEFKATIFSYVMLMIPVTFTVLFPVLLVGRSLRENAGLVVDRDSFWGVVVGILAGVTSYYAYRHIRKVIAFDKNDAYFWKGKEAFKLDDIHALQLIHEWISGSGKGNRPYKSYELNLVLKSGDRVGVVDHGNIKRLREDATMLAQFLNVPLWDGTVLKAV